MDALLIVDLQNDFCPGGSLAVSGADEIVPRVVELAREAPLVIATRDWHPADHASFDREGGPWPPHCIQGTPGSELHPDLDRELLDAIVDTGQGREDEGYSAFEVPALAETLRARGVRDLHVVGLALDVCVRATALDAAREGFDVTLHAEATRPVDAAAGDETVEELRAAGVTVA